MISSYPKKIKNKQEMLSNLLCRFLCSRSFLYFVHSSHLHPIKFHSETTQNPFHSKIRPFPNHPLLQAVLACIRLFSAFCNLLPLSLFFSFLILNKSHPASIFPHFPTTSEHPFQNFSLMYCNSPASSPKLSLALPCHTYPPQFQTDIIFMDSISVLSHCSFPCIIKEKIQRIRNKYSEHLRTLLKAQY